MAVGAGADHRVEQPLDPEPLDERGQRQPGGASAQSVAGVQASGQAREGVPVVPGAVGRLEHRR